MLPLEDLPASRSENAPVSETGSLGVEGSPASAEWLSIVQQKAALLRFGVIQITIHDGKVVQIESTERTRLDISSDRARPRRADRAK